MTKDELRVEWLKCATEFEYFADKYLLVEDKIAGKYVPFKLMPHQQTVIDSYNEHDLVITNKYRQSGITSVTCAYYAWKICFNKNVKIACVGNTLGHAKTELLKRIDDFIELVPEFLKPGRVKNAEAFKIYDNGSEIQCRAATKEGLRGLSVNEVILDEFAHYDFDSDFWLSAKSVWSMGGRCRIISTPNGQNNVFYEVFDLARNKKNNFYANELKWYHDVRLTKDLKWVSGNDSIIESLPEKQKELLSKGYKPTSTWFEAECAGFNFDKRKIAQELEGEFLGSGGSFIDEELLMEQIENYVTKPMYYENFDRNFWIWKLPEDENQKFIIGVDVSTGKAEDYSTITIIDAETQEMYAEYRGKVEPEVLGDIVYEFARKYNDGYVIVDVTGYCGVPTVKKLLNEYGYKNIYYSEIKDRFIKDKMEDEGMGDLRPGIVIGKNRTDILDALNKAFNKKEIIIRSSRLVDELKGFKYVNGKPDHKRSGTSDNIFSLALALYANEKNNGVNKQSVERAKVMLSNWVVANYSDEDYIRQIHKAETQQPNKKQKEFVGLFFFG